MAIKSLIEREKKRLQLYKKYEKKRLKLLQQLKLTQIFKLKKEIMFKLQKLPRNSSKTRIRNICWKTGRTRSVLKDFGVSRQIFREMSHQGLLPGIQKSSW